MVVDPLAAALHELAQVFGDGMTADHVGGKFTCTEAERIADVLTLSGHGHAAEIWLRGHAEGDEASDQHGICRHCDAVLHLDEDTETATDLRGSTWCSWDRVTEHEPTSWVPAGEEG